MRIIPASNGIPLAGLVILIWVTIELYLKKHPVLWITPQGSPSRINKLGIMRRSAFVGSIVLLLVPFVFDKFARKEVEPNNGTVRPLIGVKMYGVERKHSDDNDATKMWTQKLRADDYAPIVYSDAEELVDGILARLDDKHAIRELTLFGYGGPGIFTVGKGQSPHFEELTYLTPTEVQTGKMVFLLGQLRGRFLPGAKVKLVGCKVGAGSEGADLLFQLSKALNAKVYAPVGLVTSNDYAGVWQAAEPEMNMPPTPLFASESGPTLLSARDL